ncbi:MAG: hypothetical protein WCP20_03975 [Desulfuromonadales bacterium]
MNIIPAIADEFLAAGGIGAWFFFEPEPGVILLWAVWFRTTILVFKGKRNGTEQPCPLFADICGTQERSDILADAIVDVWMPPLGLLFQRFPADENIIARVGFRVGFAFQYLGQFGLKRKRGAQACGSSRFITLCIV